MTFATGGRARGDAVERRLFPRAPVNEAVLDRAIEVQGELGQATGSRRSLDLVVAAAAELAGLVLLHYDHDFDLIAAVTGQPMERVVPSTRTGATKARPRGRASVQIA